MKAIRTLILAGVVVVLPWGLASYATAGCGGSQSCGMSHAQSQPSSATQAKPGQYTCPMHPEVVSDKQGKCPKCGMALEKVTGQSSEVQPTDDMAVQCQQIFDEFTALQDHFDMMMKLTDVGYLAEAMVKHQEMMTKFAENLANHQRVCRKADSSVDDSRSSTDSHANHGH